MITVFDYFNKRNNENKFIIPFIENIIRKDYILPQIKYEYQPYLVLNRILNREIRQFVIKTLISCQYDFKSPFPYDKFKTISSMEIIKNNLIKEFEYYTFYLTKGVSFSSKNNLKCLLVSTKTNLNSFAFANSYSLVINLYEKEMYIAINPALNNDYSLFNLYKKLNALEKDTWSLWNGETVLKTKKSIKTSISKTEIKNIIKEFDLSL